MAYSKLIKLGRYIKRFGFRYGLQLFLQNDFFKTGESTVFLPIYKHSFSLRRYATDINTFEQIFLGLGYDYPLNFEPNFIVDCGANVGLSALFFKAKYPKATIIAVEPESSNFEMLERNVSSYPDIYCIQSGVWNRNVVLKVEDDKNFGNWGFNCKPVSDIGFGTVNSVTIDQILSDFSQNEIDILKVDIEGSELELFSDNYEKWLPNTKVIMIETHDGLKKGCSKAFFSAISKYKFSVFIRGENFICIRD